MKRYVLLDLIRILAISLLLTAHIGQTLNLSIGEPFGIKGFYYVSFGGLAVTIFLVLSGMALELQHANNIDYFTYIAKRILRLYPIYYLSLLFGIALYLLRNHLDGLTIYSAMSQLHFSDILLCITGGYAFVGKWGGPFVATSWFVGLIMTLYLIYPAISSAARKQPIMILCSAFIMSAISRVLFGNFQLLPGYPLEWFPSCRVFEFTLGIVLANKIKNEFLHILDNLNASIEKSINFISQLSFPLFLFHYPLCFIISVLTVRGVSKPLSIVCFLSISSAISVLAMNIDKLVPRQQILRGIANWKKRD